MTDKLNGLPPLKELSSLAIRGGIVDVSVVAESLGISIIESSELDLRNVVSTLRCEDEVPTITISRRDNSYFARKRYNIAYQIGNFYLNVGNHKIGFVETRNSLDPATGFWRAGASNAHHFASDLLMPIDLILLYSETILSEHKLMSNLPITLWQFTDSLARILEVPNSVMVAKLKSLSNYGLLAGKAA